MGKRNGRGFFLPLQGAANPAIADREYGDDASIMQGDPQQMSPWFYWRGLEEGSADKAALN